MAKGRKKQSIESAWRELQRGADSFEKTVSRHRRFFHDSRVKNLRDIRSSVVTWLSLTSLLIVAVLLQNIVYGMNFQTEAGVRGGTYAEGVVGKITSFNPLLAVTDDEKAASRLVYGSLLKFDEEGNLYGDIAESWIVSPDGLSYDVKIRRNVYWQNTNDAVTVDDVIFTTELMKSPIINSPLYGAWKAIKVEKIDDGIVRFTLKTALASFPQVLTFGILSKQELAGIKLTEMRDYLGEHVARGTGPYEFRSKTVSQSKNEVLYFYANKAYSFGEPKISSIHIETFQNDNDMTNSFNRGEINVATGLSLASARDAAKANSKTIHATQLDSGVFALFNTDSEVVNGQNIRQALRLAIDREVLRSSMSVGGRPPKALETPIAPGIYNSIDNVMQPLANSGEAASMLDLSGWPIGRDKVREKSGKPLTLRVVTVRDSDYEGAARNLVEQWRSIGVDAELTLADAESFQQNFLVPRNYDVLVYQLQLGADADQYAYWHSSDAKAQGLNFSNYTSSVADLSLARGRSTFDDAARETQYKTFVDAWMDDVPAIALYQTDLYSLMAMNIRSYGAHTIVSEADRYYGVIDWTVNTVPVNKTP